MKRLFLLFLVILPNTIKAQTVVFDQNQYWYYRDRLQYFVYPGLEDGSSVLMTCRNSNGREEWDSDRLYNGAEWGQTRKMNGYYIGLLATEYKLLKDNGQYSDAAATLQELNLALDALIRMDKCEDDISFCCFVQLGGIKHTI